MKTFRFLILLLVIAVAALPQAKKPLDHDAFDGWQNVFNKALSNDGAWCATILEPQEGDALLSIYNVKTGKEIKIERGYNPTFASDSKWAVALVKPLFADTRKAKIDGKKDLKLPQDSLAIINLTTGKVEKIANVKSYKIGEKGGNWVAYQSVDTLYAKPSELEEKKAGKPLVIRQLDGKVQKVLKWVDEYELSKDGRRLAVTIAKAKSDSVATDGVGVMLLPDTAFYLIDRDKKFYGKPVFDEAGEKLAYTAGNDSVESGTKKLSLYMASMKALMESPKEFAINFPGSNRGRHLMRPNPNDTITGGKMMQEWVERMQRSRTDSLFINQYSTPRFSYNGKRLVIGVAPYIAPDDTTIVDFERASLDIWRWDAPMTPPQEKSNLKSLREKQFPVVIDLASGDYILLSRAPYAEVTAPDRWDADWALIADPAENIIERQWNYIAPEQLSIVNIVSGERREIGSAQKSNSLLSPCDKYVVKYQNRHFYSYCIETGDSACITAKMPYPIWNDEEDYPMEKQPYGIAGWAEDDAVFYIYDKHDIWGLDPRGVKAPFCLTNGEGRKTGRRYKYVKTDPEQRYFSPGNLMVLSVFDYATKENGLATMKYEAKPATPTLRLLEGAMFTQFRKAKNADVFSWQRAAFDIKPDIWAVRGLNFSRAVQITDGNPQMKDYSWGTAQLFRWTAYDGKESEGVLYLPEDFSPDKEYPMLAVFYETGADLLYRHYTMEPSWSWINYPFYVSRGYVVFVPDIHYTPGLPGESAYNYVCSGVEAVCDLYPNIDRKRIGIDGQSWGGYQTAYLVTRTDMFACAGSGAPVANMTSAFGGIRWETGDSRQAQYEQGQSRIGATLWEKPELYIANSPLFRADRCHTPLLIMHNDADGAVPWYQGIELFMALRRLHKPVWMLQYNGEAHNIKERRNRKDITIRLQQFFDHYLKGDPMPRWMEEGIPALRKGQEMGY